MVKLVRKLSFSLFTGFEILCLFILGLFVMLRWKSYGMQGKFLAWTGLVIWSFYISVSSLFAQQYNNYFSTLTVRDGLPSNIIAAVEQDQYDFIWVGTGSGLARYDGYRFKIFKRTEDANSLSSNEITALLADGDYLWVGTWSGLSRIHVKTFEVERIDLGSTQAIRVLHKGRNDGIWAGTGGGLYHISKDAQKLEEFNVQNSDLSHDMVRSVYEDGAGNLWAGTYDGLNVKKKGAGFEKIDLIKDDYPSFSNHLILAIKPDHQNGDSILWIGTETGLYRYHTRKKSITHFGENNAGFSNEVIKNIYVDLNNDLWLGTDFGLNIFNPKTGSNEAIFHDPQVKLSIANNVIWQIFEDSGGVIWLVTSNGLSRTIKTGNFFEFREVSQLINERNIGNQVKTAKVDQAGNIWLGTQHGVVYIDHENGEKSIFDTRSMANRRILSDNVFALEEDDEGKIWIGSSGGINVWDPASQQMQSITSSQENGLTSNYIGNFSKAANGVMWVSAWEGGLFKIQGSDQTNQGYNFIRVPDGITGSEKFATGSGYVWTMMGDELYRVDPHQLNHVRVDAFNNVSKKSLIYTLYFAKDGMLWAGTSNGLIQYNPVTNVARFHDIRTGDEVNVTSIIEDRSGNIWSASSNAIYKIKAPSGDIEQYPLDKNLPLKSFYYGCAAFTHDNQIIFGGDNGYIQFDPGVVEPNVFQPKIFITAIEINNRRIANDMPNDMVTLEQDISFVENIRLEYKHRSVGLVFSSLHYWQPDNNVFAYRLEGLEEEWQFVSGNKNFANYANLSPGTYKFQVKGSNNFGLESDQIASLTIMVDPPLFLSKGFIMLYVILAIVMVYLALKIYTNRIHLQNELKIMSMEKEHLREIEQTKEKFFTNISHELRTPISLILPPIHQVQKQSELDEDSQILMGLAEKNSRRLLRLVNQILDFNKLESEPLQLRIRSQDIVAFCYEVFWLFKDKANRSSIDFQFDGPEKSVETWFDQEKLETVLFNLLSNAFKFTPKGGNIRMVISRMPESISYPKGAVCIEVIDSGVGMDEKDINKVFDRFYQADAGKSIDASTGIGLTLVTEYVALHHGKVNLESKKGEGSKFSIEIPLGKEHYPIDLIQDESQYQLLAKRTVHTPNYAKRPYQLDLEGDKPLILLIEDNPDVVDFIYRSLHDKFNFVVAEHGEEGLKRMEKFMPEVVVSDIMMPVMDGLEFCRTIKSNPHTSHVSVILLTAKGLSRQKAEGIRTGADVYLTKPFEIEVLEAYINHLIERKQELQHFFRNDLMNGKSELDLNNNQDNIFIKQVLDIIEAHIADPDFGVEKISEILAISSTHLYRKLKALTGLSTKDIIMKYRIKKASLMLKNKEGNISEVMYQLGFSSLSYFSKCFKAEYGMTPKAYQHKYAKSFFDIENE